jgi:LEA14-like dessication related protein
LVNGTPAIIISFRIFNPGIIGARVNTIAGQVLLEGNQIGSIEFFTPTNIPPQGQVIVNIPIKITVGILPTLISLLKGELKGYRVNTNGTVFTTAGAINFNNTIDLN